MPNPNHVYVPETNIWDLDEDEIRELDPNSEEFKELIVELTQFSNLHAMAINRNNYGSEGGGGCMLWTQIDERYGTVMEPCNGYLANGNNYRIEFHLPAVVPQGAFFAITGMNTSAGGAVGFGNGWELYPAAGQSITIVDEAGDTVVGGINHLRSLYGRPCAYIQCVCVEANTRFVAGALHGLQHFSTIEIHND